MIDWVIPGILAALFACVIALLMALSVQPPQSAQLRNAYWPYSVEVVIIDK